MTQARTESESLESLLARLEPLWLEAGNRKTGKRLLRLSLLRELTRAIHTLRSEFMATDRSSNATDFARRENFLNQYFSKLDLESSTLLEIYRETTQSKPSHPHEFARPAIPEGLTQTIGATKLSRQDRKWELEMAQEALHLGWEFWQFEASTEIQDVERFAKSVAKHLWPNGVILYVESDGFLKVSEKNPELAHWRGRWILVQDPQTAAPAQLRVRQDADPKWLKLYPKS